ncbi:MAG: hypothetical protein M3Y27_29505 [Acidobacteriota bacterium]|nr:hypothetical protein [Acidobacteriota bacterium]
MASPSFAPDSASGRRISLGALDATVSARLGPTRGLGNPPQTCFNRQVAMYLASRVGRWSTTVIGRFYNGRDHSTVVHGIQRIESMRESDPDLDALLSDLKRDLTDVDPIQPKTMDKACGSQVSLSQGDLDELADLIAERVFARLQKRMLV